MMSKLWRWWKLREARNYWCGRNRKRKDALEGGYITDWQRWHFGWDYYGVRWLVRKALGDKS